MNPIHFLQKHKIWFNTIKNRFGKFYVGVNNDILLNISNNDVQEILKVIYDPLFLYFYTTLIMFDKYDSILDEGKDIININLYENVIVIAFFTVSLH